MNAERAFDDITGALADVFDLPKDERASPAIKKDLYTKLYYSQGTAAEKNLWLADIAKTQNIKHETAKAEFTESKKAIEKTQTEKPYQPLKTKSVYQRPAQDPNADTPETFELLETETAENLLARTFAPILWTAKPILAEGLAMLAGSPKSGKSWLALALSLAVATGRSFLDEYSCEPGRALFMGLEDGPRRLQDRIKLLTEPFIKGSKVEKLDLTLLETSTEIPKSTEGGLEMLDGWLALHTDARLVVIDTLARFRKDPGRNGGYMNDSGFMAPLQKMALDHHCCILLIHHSRKMAAADPMDAISGTLGLGGVADTAWILKRESRFCGDAILSIMARDFQDQEISLHFNTATMRWEYKGVAWEIKRTAERQSIVELLAEVTVAKPLGPSAIAKAIGKDQGNISKQLKILHRDGLIHSAGNGKYYGKEPSI